MVDLVFKNFSSTSLATDLAADELNCVVSQGIVFPDAPSEGEFVVVIEDVSGNKEICRCTSRSGDVLVIERAQEGTTARAFPLGSIIELRYTAGSMDEYFVRIGYDGGDWSVNPGPPRGSIKLRRNVNAPNDSPDELYEGELGVNLASIVPSLYVGPIGAVGDGVGISTTPIYFGPTEPTTGLFENLMWVNTNTLRFMIYHNGQFTNIKVNDVLDKDYALKSDLDTLENDLTGNLYAPANTHMLFYQEVAPAGWSKVTTVHDRLFRCVNDDSGGSTEPGTWAISGLAAQSVALSIAQLPSHDHGGGAHSHTYSYAIANEISKAPGSGLIFREILGYQEAYTGVGTVVIAPQGSGEPHGHAVTSTAAWRPPSLNCIICRKL